MNKKTTTSKVYYLRFYSARKKRLQRGAGWEGKRDDLKKIWGSHIRRNFEGDDIIFFLKFSELNVSTYKTEKKTAVQQPLPPKTAIFRRKLTFSGHTRRIFNDNDPIFF